MTKLGKDSLPSLRFYQAGETQRFLSSLHHETRKAFQRTERITSIKQEYIHYLNDQHWDYFLTGTTRYSLSQRSARRLAERYFSMLTSDTTDRMFYVSERFELKDGHHIHALLRTQTNFTSLIDLWQYATGNSSTLSGAGTFSWHKTGWNRIQLKTYLPRIGAAGYCSKYILKRSADYDLFAPGNNEITMKDL